MRRRAGERGSALVAVVAATLAFSMLAVGFVEATRGTVVSGGAELDAARAGAAADAGLALAIHNLVNAGPERRLPIDGRPTTLGFEGATLQVRVLDERGRVPINIIEDEQVTLLLEAMGLEGQSLRVARDSLLDWLDDDDEPRLNGAETAFYAPLGTLPRNGPLYSIGELGRIRGFTPALVEKLKPVITIHFGSGSFDPRFAHPTAIGVMYGNSAGGPAEIARQRELEGQRTAIALDGDVELIGRPLTIEVAASIPSGGRAVRRAVVTLTGADTRPYVIRSYG